MTHKVLLADDSLTIQKVIKITLANEPYTLLDCRSEADLMNVLERESPHLVLLDFGLSEARSGYELCKLIRSKKPQTSVLMMYGTFDTVDENALKNCGAKGKIIKPFDSGKFISLCKSLIDELEGDTQVSAPGKVEEVFSPGKEEEVDWVMDAPTAPEKKSPEAPKSQTKDNHLEEEMRAWGISVPEKISGGGEVIHFPPKIDSENAPKTLTRAKLEEDSTLPASADLEYPDMSISLSVEETSSLEIETPVAGPKSKLVPLSELKPASDKELTFEEDTGSFELSLEDGTTSDEDIRRLEEQISDEIEHAVPRKSETIVPLEEKNDGMSLKNFADLWAADEIEELNPTIKKDKSTEEKIKVVPDLIAEVELEQGHHDDKLETHPTVIKEMKKDISDLRIDANLGPEFEAKIREAVKPIIEQMVKEYARQTLEKVAWEVIPDLAENLIKKELQKISDSIIGE